VAGLVLFLVAVAAFLLLRDDRTAVIPEPQEPGESTPGGTTRASSGAELLSELETSLTSGRRQEVLGLAEPGNRAATRSLGEIFDNVRALGIQDISLRYVDEDAGRLRRAEERRLNGNGWVADVQMGWRIGGYDAGRSEMEVSFTFVETARGAAFVSASGDYGNPAPLWLLDDLAVQQSARALVMAADPDQLDTFAALADRAVADVKRVLPGWSGKLVVEVPESQDQLNRVLDAKEDAYDSIAAVTSTVDGSLLPSSPAHIMVNPKVFTRLGDQGSQIVMSHEATHVATDAATSSMPMWLLEGFADYVALAHVDLPVSVTASQILAEVRRGGPPAHLPASDEFDPSNKALGASYESAWLACRLLAEKYGERALVDFYQAVDSSSSIDGAFRRLLGTNERQFTRDWQEYLRDLAS
jgi:hypothetical protein